MVIHLKKYSFIFIILTIFSILIIIYLTSLDKSNKLNAIVVSENEDNLTLLTSNDLIYNISKNKLNAKFEDNILITYNKSPDELTNILDLDIVNYEINPKNKKKNTFETGIFNKYYEKAYNKLLELTLDEKIGQLFLIRYDEDNALNDLSKYKVGGFVFYEKDFQNKTKDEVLNMINSLNEGNNIPLLISTDEEGGKVVRVSSNPNLSSERFKSSHELYQTGGMLAIKEDTIKKSNLLKSLGINLNLAPVVDVSTNPLNYIHERTIQENTEITSEYAKTVITASHNTGVTYAMKHFPGYGNNQDTHKTSSIDKRSYEMIMNNDIPPFKTGIENNAEAILISHNIVTSIDSLNEASLSNAIHNLLRNTLSFTGIIITDDISMKAISKPVEASLKAVLAGNNLIITSNPDISIQTIKNAVSSKIISEELINALSLRVLAFKYYKGLIN